MRIYFAIFASLLFLAAPARADITIGLAGPFTGENAFLGEQMKRGAEQAVADINAHGGIRGEKIILRQADDACDPKQAVTVANRLVSEGIKFVVGHACSGSSIPASRVYNEEGVLMITPISSNPALTAAGFANVFRAIGRDDQEGDIVGQYILDHYRDKRIAIVHDQSAWGRGIAEELRKKLNAGGIKKVMFEAITPGEHDYSPLITKIKQAHVDVIFLGTHFVEAGLITRQSKEQGTHVQIIGGDVLVTDQLWSITGPAGEGVLMSFLSDPRKRPEAQTVVNVFRKSGFEPEGYTLNTYAAFQVLSKGFERAGKTDPRKVAIALREGPINTVIGNLSFDARGDITGSYYIMYRWHDGKYAEVAE